MTNEITILLTKCLNYNEKEVLLCWNVGSRVADIRVL